MSPSHRLVVVYPTRLEAGLRIAKLSRSPAVSKDTVKNTAFEDKISSGYYYEGSEGSSQEYLASRKSKMEEFKRDLFEFRGVTGHPKANRAFEIAYNCTDGDLEVTALVFAELIELF
jgi:hypothetical protein